MPEDSNNLYAGQGSEDEEISLVELLDTVWSGRKLIFGVTFLFAVTSIIFSLMLSNKYTASVTILPDTDAKGVGQLAQFAGLASMAGISLGGVSEIELYPAIIGSESVLRDVIYAPYVTEKFGKPLNLIQFWEIEGETEDESYELALKKLRESAINVSVARDTRLVTLSVETEEPKLSTEIANSIAGRLDSYMVTQRRTKASEQRQWIEQRLQEVETALASSEESMKDFRERNRRIIDSPQLILEEGRLMRELEMNNAMFIELKKQYEAVKIQEIRDMPVVQVLDYARVPVEKSGPRRSMIVIIATAIGGFISLGLVFVRNYFDSSEENKTFFRRITDDVKKDLKFVK